MSAAAEGLNAPRLETLATLLCKPAWRELCMPLAVPWKIKQYQLLGDQRRERSRSSPCCVHQHCGVAESAGPGWGVMGGLQLA